MRNINLVCIVVILMPSCSYKSVGNKIADPYLLYLSSGLVDHPAFQHWLLKSELNKHLKVSIKSNQKAHLFCVFILLKVNLPNLTNILLIHQEVNATQFYLHLYSIALRTLLLSPLNTVLPQRHKNVQR